jgi:hypothetical protein
MVSAAPLHSGAPNISWIVIVFVVIVHSPLFSGGLSAGAASFN